MEIIEGKIVGWEQARSVGQNQNFAQVITIEGKSGKQKTGEILVKEKNIIQQRGTGFFKWEVSEGQYGTKLKKHRDTPYQGGQQSQQGGGKGSNRSFAMSYAKDLVVAGKAEISALQAQATEILAWLDGETYPEAPATGGSPPPDDEQIPF